MAKSFILDLFFSTLDRPGGDDNYAGNGDNQDGDDGEDGNGDVLLLPLHCNSDLWKSEEPFWSSLEQHGALKEEKQKNTDTS